MHIYGINGLLDKSSLCFMDFSVFLILCFQNTHMSSISRYLLYSKSKFACVLKYISSHAWYSGCTSLVLWTDVMTDLAASVNMWTKVLAWWKHFYFIDIWFIGTSQLPQPVLDLARSNVCTPMVCIFGSRLRQVRKIISHFILFVTYIPKANWCNTILGVSLV